MSSLQMGYLFKKKHIFYEDKKYEIFEFTDYVCGIGFKNINNNDRFNILSGSNAGMYASFINKKANEEEYVFISESVEDAIKFNNNNVDFLNIRKKRIETTSKYYLRDDKGTGLVQLLNRDLLTYLCSLDETEKSDFDDTKYEKTIDISSMYESIKKTIISQDEQIIQILTSLFKNQTIINSNLDMDLIAKLKENILLCGSTGTGKTEILKRISKLYNIPIVIEDATSLSETGYVGRKITDMLDDLCVAADGDVELAERGILVIDEFDKLAEKPKDGDSHVSRLGVQRSLLKLLDGHVFYFEDIEFDTSKLTVVCLGAFIGITNGDYYKELEVDDFIEYGIMRELISRFSKTIFMNPLEKEDIIKILKESNFSPLNTYKEMFKVLDVDFEFNNEFVEYIAKLAIDKKSGARSLKTVFDNCIDSALFKIFTGEYKGISLIKPDNINEKPYILTKTNK